MTKGIRATTGKHVAYGSRRTVQQRRLMRDQNNIRTGRDPGWAEEALDYYLSGIPVPEILEAMKITQKAFYNGISKAALYRLMVQHQAERLEEIPELTETKNK